MSIVGLAVVGKNNEPLYLCDCTRFAANGEPPSDNNSSDRKDRFGFHALTRNSPPNKNLPLERQFIMHAALDRMEEMIDGPIVGMSSESSGGTATTSPKSSSMPVVRRLSGTAASSHWMGNLMQVDDHDWCVFGYITATSIKFLALVDSSALENDVKVFLTQMHLHFNHYMMNPFSPTEGTIESKQFDANVEKAVQDYEKMVAGRSEI